VGTKRGVIRVCGALMHQRVLSIAGAGLAIAMAGLTVHTRSAQAVSIMFTTFGTCNNPQCSVTLSSPGDTLTFNQTNLGDPFTTGTWDASGTVAVSASPGSLIVNLTNASVQDVIPGPPDTSNELFAGMEISSAPRTIAATGGSTGFASLNGIFTNSTGTMQDAVLTNFATLGGGVILGETFAAAALPTPSGTLFNDFAPGLFFPLRPSR
jgi:hypothetical protein